MAVSNSRRRIDAERRAFLDYETKCPFCKTPVGPRFVTREHLDVPPNPPYAATVKCPKCGEIFEVRFPD
jgi:phage FluMu protein Com